ncbi:MAG: GldG family protein [Acidobacteriota bacterium]
MYLLKTISGYLGPALLFGAFAYRRLVAGEWNRTAQILLIVGAVVTLFYLATQLGDIRRTLQRRSTRYSSALGLTLVFFFGILILVNFLGYRHNKRWDLTENKQFSLSAQTVQLVKGLQQDVEIVRFSKLRNATFGDLVSEYQELSPKVSVRVIDPEEQPGLARQFEVRQPDEMFVRIGEKKEKMSDISEQALTNALLKLTRTKSRRICFSRGHQEKSPDERDPRQGMGRAKERLQALNYSVDAMNLAEEPDSPINCDLLVIAGPKNALLPTEIERIGRYLDGGGNLLALIDPEADGGLSELLKSRGIELQNVTVVDASGLGRIFGAGPAIPLVTEVQPHAMTRELSGTMSFYPLARSLKKVDATGFTVTELFKTGPRSWGETELKAEVKFDEGKDEKGPLTLAIASAKPVAEAPAVPPGEGKAPPAPRESRVIVIGDSDFATDGTYAQQANGDVFINAVAWVAGDEEVVSIAPKSPRQRLIQLTEAQGQMVRWLTMIVMPLFVLVAGVWVWSKRR